MSVCLPSSAPARRLRALGGPPGPTSWTFLGTFFWDPEWDMKYQGKPMENDGKRMNVKDLTILNVGDSDFTSNLSHSKWWVFSMLEDWWHWCPRRCVQEGDPSLLQDKSSWVVIPNMIWFSQNWHASYNDVWPRTTRKKESPSPPPNTSSCKEMWLMASSSHISCEQDFIGGLWCCLTPESCDHIITQNRCTTLSPIPMTPAQA